MPLLGVDDNYPLPLERTAFRTSWTTPEGNVATQMFEARVVDVNPVAWTVDVRTVFDAKQFFDIQVAAPYLHPSYGEGCYMMPEIGSKCLVTLPGDGSPPVVTAFIMPSEAVPQAASEQAALGTDGGSVDEARVTSSTYAGGRPVTKPGDIVLRGRDGNFCILHRGGVLQIGASPLSQRICVPLGHLMTDVSQYYSHFNSGGSINWGLRMSAPENAQATEFRQTFRVFADDEFADVRLSCGRVQQPVAEVSGDAGSASDLDALEIAKDADIVFELVLAPGGFDTGAGVPNEDAHDLVKLKMFFDRDGNYMFRSVGNLSIRANKLRIRTDDSFELFTKGAMTVEADGVTKIRGGKSLELSTDGGVVKINGGTKPVATVGSMVQITIPAPIMLTTSAGPATIVAGQVFFGIVSSGNPTVLV